MSNPLQQQNTIPSLKTTIEKKIDETITQHVQWWRNLPSIISNSHVKVLQVGSRRLLYFFFGNPLKALYCKFPPTFCTNNFINTVNCEK